jgi:hypothetical protein
LTTGVVDSSARNERVERARLTGNPGTVERMNKINVGLKEGSREEKERPYWLYQDIGDGTRPAN